MRLISAGGYIWGIHNASHRRRRLKLECWLRLCVCGCVFVGLCVWFCVRWVVCLCAGGCSRASTIIFFTSLPALPKTGWRFGDNFGVGTELCQTPRTVIEKDTES